MPPVPRMVPGRRHRIGSDPASIALFDRLSSCGALEVLGWTTNEAGTVTSPVFHRERSDPREPLGFWHEVVLRDGVFGVPEP